VRIAEGLHRFENEISNGITHQDPTVVNTSLKISSIGSPNSEMPAGMNT
jgi:hypothetical protein